MSLEEPETFCSVVIQGRGLFYKFNLWAALKLVLNCNFRELGLHRRKSILYLKSCLRQARRMP